MLVVVTGVLHGIARVAAYGRRQCYGFGVTTFSSTGVVDVA